MVNENYAYAYCIEDISKIENYDKAISDTTQTWVCHHRLEMQDGPFNSVEYLKKNNLYYHRPAAELIFLTRGEHTKLHTLGRRLSEESCRKISEANKGKKFSDEHRRKLSEAAQRQHRVGENNPFYGKHHTEDTRKKISESNKGRTFSEEHCRNLSVSLKGRVISEDTKKKISESVKGEKNGFYGKHHSEDTRKKISESNKGRTFSEETRRKMSESQKGRAPTNGTLGMHWYNNGSVNKCAYECPEGFVRGMLKNG